MEDESIRIEIPNLGPALLPKRFLGRRSRVTGLATVAVHAVSRETGIPHPTVSAIVHGHQRPRARTLSQLAAVGIVIERPAYSQRERVPRTFVATCKGCGNLYNARRRDSRFCTSICYMRQWHARASRDGLCNYCGKVADGHYATTCRAHDAAHRRNQQAQKRRKQERHATLGRCIDCSRDRATIGMRCARCRELQVAYGRARRKRQREAWRQRGLITVTETARLLGFKSRSSVHRRIARGELHVVARTGRHEGLLWLSRGEVVLSSGRSQATPFLPRPIRCPKCRGRVLRDAERELYCFACGWRPTRRATEDERRETEPLMGGLSRRRRPRTAGVRL